MLKEGSLSLDRQGRIIRFSKSLEGMLGYEAAEVIGKDLSVLAPGGPNGILDQVSELLEAEGSARGKTAVLCKDGSACELYFSANNLRDIGNEPYSLLLTFSRRKAGPPAFLADEFRRMFRFSTDAVIITDLEGYMIDVNPAFIQTYGYERSEVLGRNPRMLKSPHTPRSLYERMWKEILDPAIGSWKGEIINLARSGREVPVLLSINAVRDHEGMVRNFLGMAFDLTRLKELDRLHKIYIDHIVHDIRGPLTSITLNSEMLMMQPGLDARVRGRLEIISSCAVKIGAMTADMLDLGRAESGSLALRIEDVPLARVLREAALPFEGSRKTLLLNGEIFASEVVGQLQVQADPDKLQRIVYNLLSNAFKHAATTVSVTAGLTDEGFCLSVSDDGRGIPREEADRIFEAFYQTEEGVKIGGAGLGLSIVKSFVEAHGGRVWVEAGREGGATFGLTIPAAATA